MQSAAFFAFHCLTHNQISYVDHITQFANLSGGYAAFEQAFSFFVNDIQSVPGTFQAKVAADNTYIVLIIWLTSFMLCVISTISSGERVPSSFHSGMASL